MHIVVIIPTCVASVAVDRRIVSSSPKSSRIERRQPTRVSQIARTGCHAVIKYSTINLYASLKSSNSLSHSSAVAAFFAHGGVLSRFANPELLTSRRKWKLRGNCRALNLFPECFRCAGWADWPSPGIAYRRHVIVGGTSGMVACFSNASVAETKEPQIDLSSSSLSVARPS